ncbi:hypothetical protein [Thiorhodovibrio frisius]|uniref:Uncharacterized protein n=1 Tax=Thiorhodovibrio frisius TaxID=631362 RepID=H8Z0G8_9GAMM|nr:hypothetical protein [Thiorhodovibrio frisius]EIC21269.1 hypothetical protein Thi970DRAFT_01462 [Thiorhodovibrio frisius]WPL23846.1 hypothetical protein Thiofri_04052 [Thiorhodovibrio frisius]
MPVVEAEPTFEEARPIFRLGVDAYHQMIRAGIFDEDDRVELIEEPKVQARNFGVAVGTPSTRLTE